MSKVLRLAFALAFTLALALGFVPAQAQDTVRPAVGAPLQAAQQLIKAGKYKQALAKVDEAGEVPNRTAGENLLIARMRLAAASGAGDMAMAAKSYEAITATGKLPAADKLRIIESIAGGYYRAKEYAKAVEWAQRYEKEGGSSAQMQTLMLQAQYLSGDTAAVTKGGSVLLLRLSDPRSRRLDPRRDRRRRAGQGGGQARRGLRHEGAVLRL